MIPPPPSPHFTNIFRYPTHTKLTAARKCLVKKTIYRPDDIRIRPDDMLIHPGDILIRPGDF